MAAKYKWHKPIADIDIIDRRAKLVGLHPCEIAQAFSHYSYLFTQREILVVDLQGVVSEKAGRRVLKLTDPAVHTGWRRRDRFGVTDKGEKGVEKFFKHHWCNALCESLGLRW